MFWCALLCAISQELLQARLADATKLNAEAQDRHTARLKEVARRLV